MTSELKLTAKDFKSDQEVRWCPGCGDYAILAAVQSFMPELGIAKENMVFVAGAIDTDKPGLTDVLRRAAAHNGASFVEIYQNCNIYNDGAFDFVREDKENRMYLKHGEVAGDTGIKHDETDLAAAFALSRV